MEKMELVDLTTDLTKRVVPWYSKSEWNDVFKKIYSNDRGLQSEAYDRMSLWKIRCPKLPTAIECTMEVLQVQLLLKNDNSFLSQKDLLLMCSTVLSRFVNHVSHLYNKKLTKKITIYNIAKKWGIPDWVVSIRHEAAHGSNLPSIDLMTLAAGSCMDWLYNNYWKVEAVEAEDFIINYSPDVTTSKIVSIVLNLWQASKLFKFANFNKIEEIPNNQLRSHLLSLCVDSILVNDATCENLDTESSQFTLQSYITDDGTVGTSELKTVDGTVVTKKLKVMTILKDIIDYLKRLLLANIDDKKYTNLFIENLVNCDTFLPVTYDYSQYSTGTKLHPSVSVVWTEVLVLYHEAHLMTDLLNKLVEISLNDDIPSRQLVAACWISHLTESLRSPGPKTRSYDGNRENETFADFFFRGGGLYENFSSNKLTLKNLNFSKNIVLNNYDIENIVNKVVMSPNSCTSIFIPSLLDILTPPLEPSAKSGIIQLVAAYTATNPSKCLSKTVYTVEMLKDETGLTVVNNNTEEKSDMELPVESIWSKDKGVYDWSSCPLGRIPEGLLNKR